MNSSQDWEDIVELLQEVVATNYEIKEALAMLKGEVRDLERRLDDAIGRRFPPG